MIRLGGLVRLTVVFLFSCLFIRLTEQRLYYFMRAAVLSAYMRQYEFIILMTLRSIQKKKIGS